jgi:hypothetical protein
MAEHVQTVVQMQSDILPVCRNVNCVRSRRAKVRNMYSHHARNRLGTWHRVMEL